MPQQLRRIARWIVYGVPFLVLSLLKVRFVSLVAPNRIGHLCVEPDCLIKEGILGLRPAFHPVLLLPFQNVANRALAAKWSQHLTVVHSEFWCGVFSRLQSLPGLSYSVQSYAVAIGDTARAPAIYAKWGKRASVLSLEQGEIARGRAELRRLGMPNDAWFVSVHSREGGYSPADEHLHSFRNSDINSYGLAMQAIVERGGWCVRVGEKSARPIGPMQGVIDYAHSDSKSDWMDMFLCARCLFFLGNSSGLYLVATAFGRPSVLANLTPMSTLPFGQGDIGIPKLLRSKATGELLSLKSVFQSPVANYRFAAQYEKDGLAVEENTREDIRDTAMEMLDQLEGGLEYSSEDRALQDRFQALFKPGHYSYGAASRIGRDFLRKYASLLDGQ